MRILTYFLFRVKGWLLSGLVSDDDDDENNSRT